MRTPSQHFDRNITECIILDFILVRMSNPAKFKLIEYWDDLHSIHIMCMLRRWTWQSGDLNITKECCHCAWGGLFTLTLDSHISCGKHCWWWCVSYWLASVLSSMGCVQRVEWEGEDSGRVSGSLSPHCDATAIGHCSAITGVQPLNSWWYISLNCTGQVVGLPRCWHTRVHDGNIVQ